MSYKPGCFLKSLAAGGRTKPSPGAKCESFHGASGFSAPVQDGTSHRAIKASVSSFQTFGDIWKRRKAFIYGWTGIQYPLEEDIKSQKLHALLKVKENS